MNLSERRKRVVQPPLQWVGVVREFGFKNGQRELQSGWLAQCLAVCEGHRNKKCQQHRSPKVPSIGEGGGVCA